VKNRIPLISTLCHSQFDTSHDGMQHNL